MGQQPNIQLDPEDFPRPVPEPGIPRRWQPSMRPGMITRPEEMPRGGAFGTPGPDAGYALRLIKIADLPERDDDIEHLLAVLMVARASLYGRAPVMEDLEVAKLLCGYGEGLPEWVEERRERWLEAGAHEIVKRRAAVGEVDADLLRSSPDEVRRALTQSA